MLVSVIIPCFNVEQYISECIESVLAQAHKEIEIICIDNNSTDNTLNILVGFQSRYPSKIFVQKEAKKGAAAARNRGLFISKGDWIQFLDADDLLKPDKIKHQLLLIQHQSAAFISAVYEKKSSDGKTSLVNIRDTDPMKGLFISGIGITSSNLFNGVEVKKVNGWNESLKSSQEADLMFRLIKNDSAVVFDNTPLTIVRQRASGQISQINPEQNWVQYIALRAEIIEYLKEYRPEYLNAEKSFYYKKFFLQIRRLAKFDMTMAQVMLEKHFDRRFSPGLNPLYDTVYKLFGFRIAQGVLAWLN